MSTFSEQISSNKAVIRFDVVGGPERTAVAEDMSFLNYRLGSVEVSHEITKEQPDITWYYDEAVKSIRYENEQLILTSFWEEGELNKIMVTMLANQMDKEGLHPFHSSSVVYRGHGILLVGGENNHGKSMTFRIRHCANSGALTRYPEMYLDMVRPGIALYGSKNIYVRKRAKGTERSDLADQDEGVKMFFGDEPEMPMCYEPTNMDLAIMPCIDGWFKTEVKPMGQFEAAYQSYHSMMNFFGLNQLLCGKHGLVMPIVDTDERRQDRGAFCAKYAAGRPYFMIRAKSPQLVFDEIDKLMEQLHLN